MRYITIAVYSIDELEEKAKKKAIKEFRETKLGELVSKEGEKINCEAYLDIYDNVELYMDDTSKEFLQGEEAIDYIQSLDISSSLMQEAYTRYLKNYTKKSSVLEFIHCADLVLSELYGSDDALEEYLKEEEYEFTEKGDLIDVSNPN